jgi:hypothetical protein
MKKRERGLELLQFVAFASSANVDSGDPTGAEQAEFVLRGAIKK